MGSDIQFIAFRTVGYCFQVVMGDRIAVLIGHKVGKRLCFPVEKVQAAAFGADPDIIVFVFHILPTKG